MQLLRGGLREPAQAGADPGRAVFVRHQDGACGLYSQAAGVPVLPGRPPLRSPSRRPGPGSSSFSPIRRHSRIWRPRRRTAPRRLRRGLCGGLDCATERCWASSRSSDSSRPSSRARNGEAPVRDRATSVRLDGIEFGDPAQSLGRDLGLRAVEYGAVQDPPEPPPPPRAGLIHSNRAPPGAV